MSLSERLRAAMIESGVSQADLARACGVKPPSVNGWLSGKSKFLRGENLLKAAAALNVSDTWLATGRGAPERNASASLLPVVESATDSGYRVALLDAEAAMGDGAVNNDYPDIVREIDFDPAYIRAMLGFVPKPGRLRLVTGRGDSMLPTIKPGDVVLVDTGCDVFDGDGLYLINTGHGQQIKRLQDRGAVVYVVSDNPAYESFPAPDETTIGGKIYLRNRLDRLG